MVFFLALHEPYVSDEHPVPINATIVRSDTLLHPAITQPDGGRIFRCLNEVQGRQGPRLVPISTLTFELDGGHLWHEVGDWEAVAEDVAALARRRACDGLTLGMPPIDARLVANGPTTISTIVERDEQGQFVREYTIGPADRMRVLELLMRNIEELEADQPWWPGDGLGRVPAEPARMPFKLWRS